MRLGARQCFENGNAYKGCVHIGVHIGQTPSYLKSINSIFLRGLITVIDFMPIFGRMVDRVEHTLFFEVP